MMLSEKSATFPDHALAMAAEMMRSQASEEWPSRRPFTSIIGTDFNCDRSCMMADDITTEPLRQSDDLTPPTDFMSLLHRSGDVVPTWTGRQRVAISSCRQWRARVDRTVIPPATGRTRP
jgi:hypothetical protein